MRRVEPLPDFDLYETLGVEPWADSTTILAAWRAGIAHAHPDRAGGAAGAAATLRAARLNAARDWLLDPVRRASYDSVRFPREPREVPLIDPLGPWPERRPRPRPPASFVPVVALLALMGFLAALVLDPMANTSATALFALSTTILVAYGGWALGRLFLRR